MLARQEIEHPLAHDAAQIECIAGVARAHQQAHLQGVLAGFGHLGYADLAVPQCLAFADPLQFSADRRDRRGVIQPQEGSAEQVRTAPCPVLERVLDEPRQGHHHPPRIPDPHHHVAAVDLLHPAPLTFHDHHIVQPDRLGQGDLQAGDQVAEHRLGRDTGDQADDAGRGQQRGADLAHHREGQQDQRDADQDDRAHQHAAQHPGLGLDATRFEIVGHLHRVVAQDRLLAGSDRAHQQPDEAAGQADMQQAQ